MSNNRTWNYSNKPTKGHPIYVEHYAVVNQALAIKVQAKKQEIIQSIKDKNKPQINLKRY